MFTDCRALRPFLLAVVALAAGCSGSTGQPSLSFFNVTPSTIGAGDSAELSWQANNIPGGCTILPGPLAVSAAGVTSVSPPDSVTYTLNCGDLTASASLTVRPKVKIDSFTVTPSAAVAETAVVLSWSASNADGCTLDQDVGDVDPTGKLTLAPASSTTWTLTCAGFMGPVSATAHVEYSTATALAAPTNVTAAGADGTLTLSWKQTGGAANIYFAAAAGVTPANVLGLPAGVKLKRVRSPYEITGLVNGHAYFFVITAVSGSIESAPTAEATGSPKSGPALGDPLFKDEWHLKNTGQVGGTAGEDINTNPAWSQGVRGQGIRVAIVDEGIDEDHEDLHVNMATGQSHDYLGDATVDLAQHGTCVAGLVASRDDNGVGLAGVAPRANLVSYNLLQDLTSANEYDSMVRGKATNWVSNNSWGDAEDSTGLLTFADPMWLKGVREGTSTGRGGLGIVYCWAAGNGGDSAHVDNANYDSQANSRYVFAIGGVGDDGKKVTYSESGANVLVATPTMGRANHGLTTTDITAELGYNDGTFPHDYTNGNYTDLMDGTSGSTPVAAGVAALILQANPALTWRDVRRVFAYSARKNDPTDPDWATNLAGLHVNHKVGFGVPDATAAVAVARAMVPGDPEKITATPLATPALPIPDNDSAGVASSITISGSEIGHLEFIEITTTIAHPRSGDLLVELHRETGPVDVLNEPHTCTGVNGAHVEKCSDITGFVFGSVRHLDEPADGVWTLTVKDLRGGNVGTLSSWKLTLYGRP